MDYKEKLATIREIFVSNASLDDQWFIDAKLGFLAMLIFGLEKIYEDDQILTSELDALTAEISEDIDANNIGDYTDKLVARFTTFIDEVRLTKGLKKVIRSNKNITNELHETKELD